MATKKGATKIPRKAAPDRPAKALCSPAPDAIETIFARFQAANPNPEGELDHSNEFTLLVAVVLSAQATDAGVNKATRELFTRASTPQAMVALGEEGLREAIQTIGLYRTKARNVIALSQALIREHGGKVPNDLAALEALPGVGRKTANVVLNIAFGQPTIAVDTHVFRLAHRLRLSQGSTPLAVETDLERLIPDSYKRHAHHWLILHGRYVCKARQPACGGCLIRDLCPYPDKTG
jgi:endonuclease-3